MTEKTILSFKFPQMSIRLVERDYGYPFPTYLVLENRRVYFKSTEYCFAAKRFVSLVVERCSALDLFYSIPFRLPVNDYEKFIHAEGV